MLILITMFIVYWFTAENIIEKMKCDFKRQIIITF